VAGPEVTRQLVVAEHTFSVQTACPEELHIQVLQSSFHEDPALLVVHEGCPVLLQMQLLQLSVQVLPGVHCGMAVSLFPEQEDGHRPYCPVI